MMPTLSNLDRGKVRNLNLHLNKNVMMVVQEIDVY